MVPSGLEFIIQFVHRIVNRALPISASDKISWNTTAYGLTEESSSLNGPSFKYGFLWCKYRQSFSIELTFSGFEIGSTPGI